MNDHTHSITEIIGTSRTSVEDAIQHGIQTAAKSLRNLDWFEVTQVKGRSRRQAMDVQNTDLERRVLAHEQILRS